MRAAAVARRPAAARARARATAHGQPARPPAGERGGPHPLRRARRHLARQPARRLHGEELRRRVRDRPRDARDPLPHLQRPRRRLPARHAPAELGLPADRPRAVRGPRPQPLARQRAVVPEPEAGLAARQARPPDDRGRGRLEALHEDRLRRRPRAGRRPSPRARRASSSPSSTRRPRRPRCAASASSSRATGPACHLEAQDFFDDDRKLTYTCYEPEGRASVWTIDLATGERVNQSAAIGFYNEVEGIFPDGRYACVESDHQSRAFGDPASFRNIDIWKLRLDGTGRDFTRLTTFNDHEGWKASNPVVSTDGRFMAFQVARTADEAGVGYGLLLLHFEREGARCRRPQRPRRHHGARASTRGLTNRYRAYRLSIWSSSGPRIRLKFPALPAARRLLTVLLYVNGVYGLGILGLLLASLVVPGPLFEALGVRPASGRDTLELGMRLIMVIGIASVPLAYVILSRLRAIVDTVRDGDPFVRPTPGASRPSRGPTSVWSCSTSASASSPPARARRCSRSTSTGASPSPPGSPFSCSSCWRGCSTTAPGCEPTSRARSDPWPSSSSSTRGSGSGA